MVILLLGMLCFKSCLPTTRVTHDMVLIVATPRFPGKALVDVSRQQHQNPQNIFKLCQKTSNSFKTRIFLFCVYTHRDASGLVILLEDRNPRTKDGFQCCNISSASCLVTFLSRHQMQRVHMNPIAGNFRIFVWLFTFMGFYFLKEFNYRRFYLFCVQKECKS